MRSFKILGAAFFAVLAFGVVAAASASATLWLKNGASLTEDNKTEAVSHGLLLLHHKGGLSGNFTGHCTGLFDGYVGPGALDLVTLALGLKGEQDLITCELIAEGTNACGSTGQSVTVHAINLPWHTLLLLTSEGKTVDHFLNESGKEPGYEFLCPSGTTGNCKGEELTNFGGNGTNGAIFEFVETDKSKCSDFGEGTISGLGELLGGITVS